MKTKERVKALNVTKQAVIKKFSSPPNNKVGRDGDLGVSIVPQKGLHLFYKMGGSWHGTRLHKYIKTHKDDVRSPSFESLSIGNVLLKTNTAGSLKVRNKLDNDDVTIEAKKIHLNTGATGAEDKELKISYDDNNHTSFTVDSDGDLKIAVTDAGSATGNIQYNGVTFNLDGANDRYIVVGQRPTEGTGSRFYLVAGQASNHDNEIGGELRLSSGQATGTGRAGHINFMMSDNSSASSGTVVNSIASVAYFDGLDATKGDLVLGSDLRLTSTAGEETKLAVANTSGVFKILTAQNSGSNTADLVMDIDGKINMEYNHADGFNIYKAADKEFEFTTHNYKQYNSTSYLQINVTDNRGATTISTQDTADSNSGHINIAPEGHTEFIRAVGCDRKGTTFADNLINTGHSGDATDIDFRAGNKQVLELTNNLDGTSAGGTEYLSLIFPATSSNFTLVLIQDGTGSRTIDSTAWRAFKSDGTTACTNTLGSNGTDGAVRWAGGTAPTLTTTVRKTDIVSIYWDADNQTACATITQNF